jgi:hypothetical protein
VQHNKATGTPAQCCSRENIWKDVTRPVIKDDIAEEQAV